VWNPRGKKKLQHIVDTTDFLECSRMTVLSWSGCEQQALAKAMPPNAAAFRPAF
jgi:hypothetical protein